MKTIIEYFLENAEKTPELTAVSDEAGSYSYVELHDLCRIVAEEISRLSLVPDGPMKKYGNAVCIGTILPRQKEVLAAFLGIMMSGNAYVFSQPDAPKERLDYILEDAGITCIITSRAIAHTFELDQSYSLILIEDILGKYANGYRSGFECRFSDASSPAYVTYTSGSTGKPKGTVDSYLYIENHVNARHYYYTPGRGECVGCIVSFSYAASTYDLFSPLKAGCSLYIFNESELLDQNICAERIIKHNITAMFMIPSMVPVIFGSGVKLPLKCIVTAGEKMKKVPQLGLIIAEIYGSSEAAAVIGRRALPDDPWDLLGKPLPGTQLFLIDDEGLLIEDVGKPGELCIINDALAFGYLGREKESSEKFVPCPFADGKRMYRSGDLMRFDQDGNYYYCGRKDNMIKINGQRAEMGEIESAVASHPLIRDAVCIIRRKNETDIPVCYYLLTDEEKDPGEETLKRFVSEKLPGFMVPVYWMCLKKFPVNVNGKVDRSKLPEFDYGSFSKCEMPKNRMERLLLDAAQKLLPDIPFGVTDDLLKLGLDSIKAVRFAGETEHLDPRITASVVMRYKNIRAILSSPKDTMWFYGDYDDKKPVLVLVHGIVPVSGFSMICDDWRKSFNILVIEPLTDHIYRIMDKPDYKGLTEYYYSKMKEILPENCVLWGIVGFSFGGQIAVSLADMIFQETGKYTHVIMGDTLVQFRYPGKVIAELTEEDDYIKMISERGKMYGDEAVNEPLDMIISKQNLVIKLINTTQHNQKYDGPVLYLDARMDYDETTQNIKISVVKSLYLDLKIISFPEYFHNDLYLKREMLKFYRNYFLSSSATI